MAQYDVVGSGALNLDIMYEVESFDAIQKAGFFLEPGHEISGSHADLLKLEQCLQSCGRLVSKSGGGSSANTVCVLSHLGRKCAFIGQVGDDEYGDFIISSMEGVDIEISSRQGSSSICMVIIDSRNRDRAMFVVPGSCQAVFHAHELEMCCCRVLHLSSLAVRQGVEWQIELIASLGNDVIMSFDPGEIYCSQGWNAIDALFQRTDILFATDHEISMLSADSNFTDMFRDWLSHGKILVRKMGASGAGCVTSEDEYFRPALEVKRIVDNTGAGDAFNAGFLNALLDDSDVEICLETGIRLAAASLEDYGRHWIDRLSRQNG